MPASSGVRIDGGTQSRKHAQARDLLPARRADLPADWVWEERHLSGAELGRALAEANGFLFDALPANRAGRLTAEQLDRLQQLHRPRDSRLAVLGGLALLAGLLVLAWAGMTGMAGLPGWAGVVGGLLLLRRGLLRAPAGDLALDLAPRQVAVVEAEVAKGCFRRASRRRAGRGGAAPVSDTFYLIAGQAVEVTAAGYAALEAGRRYRVYSVPRPSGCPLLINLEPSDLDPAPVPRPAPPPNWQALLGHWRLVGMRGRDGSSLSVLPGLRLQACEFRADGTVLLLAHPHPHPHPGVTGHDRQPPAARYLWLDQARLRLITDLQQRELTVDLRGDRLSLSTGERALEFARVGDAL